MNKSEALYEEAKGLLVGGVNSPVRAMKPFPFFVAKGEGSRLYDVDGKSYIDYCLAYGPLILGHANPKVLARVREQLERGTVYGAPTELEVALARKVVATVPSAEMVRFVNTGTEATMGAIRLARGFTRRKKIIKFEGAFHGAHDYVLVKAGSGATTHGEPDSAGVPEETTKNTVLLPFNDPEALEEAVTEEVAAVIMEPVIGNAGCILPKEDYLEQVREVTEEKGTMLIFDEVITGYRLGLGGAQGYYGVKPDITTLGKILGGGLPIGAIAAKREVMERLSPLGPVYQAGTFNGNPLSMAAGLAAIGELEDGRVYKRLETLAKSLREGLQQMAQDLGFKTRTYGVASMFQIYFTEGEVSDYHTALRADRELFLRFQRGLLARGVFLPPSQYECNFLSSAHGQGEVATTLEAAEEVLRGLRR